MPIRIIPICLLAFVLCSCTYKHMNAIPFPSYDYLLDAKTVELINLPVNVDLKNYPPQSNRPHQTERDVAFMIAVSGGGQRAAAFTLGVLAELESKQLLKEVDYFSTVSGGGWAVGAYLARRYENESAHSKCSDQAYELDIDELKSITKQLQKIRMGLFRNNCLIGKLERYVTETTPGNALRFGDIFVSKNEKPLLPYLFVNATILSNHSTFVFSPEYFDHYAINGFKYCDLEELDIELNQTPVAVGLGASSSFPGARHLTLFSDLCEDKKLEGSFLCGEEAEPIYIHLVDGGVYDNLGFKTALEVLTSLENRNMRKVMLVIDANGETDLPFSKDKNKTDSSILYDILTDGGTTANYSTYRKSIFAISEVFGVEPILIDLSMFTGYSKEEICENANNLTYLGRRKCGQLTYVCDKKDNDASSGDIYYHCGTKVKTSYKIDDCFQERLINLGRVAVRLKMEKLNRAIKGIH